MNLSKLNNEELIGIYPSLLKELKKRKIIRTNKLIGELEEYFAVDYCKKNPSWK